MVWATVVFFSSPRSLTHWKWLICGLLARSNCLEHLGMIFVLSLSREEFQRLGFSFWLSFAEAIDYIAQFLAQKSWLLISPELKFLLNPDSVMSEQKPICCFGLYFHDTILVFWTHRVHPIHSQLNLHRNLKHTMKNAAYTSEQSSAQPWQWYVTLVWDVRKATQ